MRRSIETVLLLEPRSPLALSHRLHGTQPMGRLLGFPPLGLIFRREREPVERSEDRVPGPTVIVLPRIDVSILGKTEQSLQSMALSFPRWLRAFNIGIIGGRCTPGRSGRELRGTPRPAPKPTPTLPLAIATSPPLGGLAVAAPPTTRVVEWGLPRHSIFGVPGVSSSSRRSTATELVLSATRRLGGNILERLTAALIRQKRFVAELRRSTQAPRLDRVEEARRPRVSRQSSRFASTLLRSRNLDLIPMYRRGKKFLPTPKPSEATMRWSILPAGPVARTSSSLRPGAAPAKRIADVRPADVAYREPRASSPLPARQERTKSPSAPDIDVSRLSDDVIRQIRKRLRVERERSGRL